MKRPRKGDDLLIDIFLRATMNQDVLLSLQRCRIKWKVMFLLDLIASPTVKDGVILSLGFVKESPSPQDWANWVEFWVCFTLSGLYLHVPLGK